MKIFQSVDFNLTDGDGITATAYVQGCSERCPWCHNRSLQEKKPGSYMAEDIIAKIESYKIKPTCLAISGGEPLEHPDGVSWLLWKAKSTGLKTILYTNGLHPENLYDMRRYLDEVILSVKGNIYFYELDKYLNVMASIGVCKLHDIPVVLQILKSIHQERTEELVQHWSKLHDRILTD